MVGIFVGITVGVSLGEVVVGDTLGLVVGSVVNVEINFEIWGVGVSKSLCFETFLRFLRCDNCEAFSQKNFSVDDGNIKLSQIVDLPVSQSFPFDATRQENYTYVWTSNTDHTQMYSLVGHFIIKKCGKWRKRYLFVQSIWFMCTLQQFFSTE